MAQRATSLGPKPSLFSFCFFWVFVVFFFAFLSLFFDRQKTCFSPIEKGIFCLFSMFLFLSPLTFLASPFFCFSFSVSLFLLSFFLSSCLSFCFLFVSCFCLFFIFLSSLLLFHEKTMNIFNCNLFFFLKYFLFLLVSCLVFCLKSFFLSLLFPDYKLCVCSTSMCLVSKKTKLKSTKKKQKNKLQQNGFFFYEPVFCKMSKVIVFFLAPFLPKFWLLFKKHYKNRYFSNILKAKKQKNAF